VDSFVQNIATAFGIKIKSASRQRFGHLCTTAGKPKLILIQKAQNAPQDVQIESVLFQHEVKEHLFNAGFETCDRFFTSKQTGLPFHKIGEDIFTVTQAYNAPHANFSDKSSFLMIAKELAHMHKHLTGAAFVHKPLNRSSLASGSKELAALEGHRKKIVKSGKYSDFDMLFLSAFEKFAPFIVISDAAFGHNKHVCHNLLKEENIFMCEKPIFTNFSMAGYNHSASDLIYLLKRYLKAGTKGDLTLSDILDVYSQSNPKEQFDSKHFIKLLQYPDKFVKISKEYYSKKRSFAPKAYITRMEECIVRGEALAGWLGADA